MLRLWKYKGLGVSYSSEGKFALKDFDISVYSGFGHGLGWALTVPANQLYLKPFAVFCLFVAGLSVFLVFLWRLPQQGGFSSPTQ